MVKVTIGEEIKNKVTNIFLGCIECDVDFMLVNDLLWNVITEECSVIASKTDIPKISQIPAIAYSRKAYKACGKDPARYRLSAEALLRRAAKGDGIYQINNIVDIVNLVSLKTGISIGGYNSYKIKGPVEFGIGKHAEPYDAIGRGNLNIEGLPVFRDELSAFGSPTSDSGRTSVTQDIKRFLMIIIGFESEAETREAVDLSLKILGEYASATNVETKIVS